MIVIVDGLKFHNVIKISFEPVDMNAAIEVQMEMASGEFESKETYNPLSIIIHEEKWVDEVRKTWIEK